MTDFFTRAEFKEHVAIPTAVTTHDAFIDSLAARITKSVDRELRRTIEQAAYKEIHDGTGDYRIRVRYPPVARTPAPVAYISGEQKWDADHTVDAADYTFEVDSGLFMLKPSAVNPDLFPQDNPIWNKGIQNVRIDYTGGFLAANFPDDLKLGAMIWAAAIFNKRRASGIASYSIGGISYTPSNDPIPKDALALLGKYRMPFRTRTVEVLP